MTGLIQARRDSAAASNDLRDMLGRAESALVIHWRGFMKTAADLLNEQQGDADGSSNSAAQPASASDGAAQPSSLPGGAEQPSFTLLFEDTSELTVPFYNVGIQLKDVGSQDWKTKE